MTNLPPVSFGRRMAALVYELLLVGAVTAVASIVAGIAATALNRTLPLISSFVVSLILLAFWWFYFKANWYKRGQTLPMKVWKIGLANQRGTRPSIVQLRMRFMWASLLIVLLPLVAYLMLRQLMPQLPPHLAFGVALIWWILPWGFAFFNADRQFLYDHLAGTRLVDLTKNQI